jgi:hypothetical protein
VRLPFMTRAQFLNIFIQELGDDKVSLDTEFKGLSTWSSLLSIIIINEIELNSGIILSVKDIIESTTIDELYDRLSTYENVN